MKNKLKLTTALVGSLVAISAGSALAQQATTYYDNGGKDGTTVSGNMNFSYRNQKMGDGGNSNAGISNLHGFGKEVQININNRGKLNNGWGYAAGFSIEADGTESSKAIYTGAGTTFASMTASTSGQTAAISGIFGENNFIDLIIGDTTITLSADHIQSPDSNPTMMGAPSSYVAPYAINNGPLNYSTQYSTASKGIYPTSLQSPYENAGVGIIQKTSIGSFSALYVPHRSSDGGSNSSFWGNDNGNTSSKIDYNGSASGYGTAYEIGFMGGFSVPGLMTSAWYNHSDISNSVGASNTLPGRMNGYKANATYAIGSSGFTVAGEYAVQNTPGAAATLNSTAGKITAGSVGLSYALTKDFTVAATYAKSGIDDGSNGGTAATVLAGNKADEKVKVISAGYSLGAVSLKGQYRETSNLGGSNASPSEKDVLIWSGVNF
jgi:hypothetical protein